VRWGAGVSECGGADENADRVRRIKVGPPCVIRRKRTARSAERKVGGDQNMQDQASLGSTFWSRGTGGTWGRQVVLLVRGQVPELRIARS